MDNTFDIEVNYRGIKEEDQIIFNQAVAKWEAIITEDIPDDGIIDDLNLDVGLHPFYDADSTVLASASLKSERNDDNFVLVEPISFLPSSANIEFNKGRIDSMSDAKMFDVSFHEIGHALGIHGNSRSFRLFIDNSNVNSNFGSNADPELPISNPRFTGENATFYYNQIYNNQETSVPIETELFPLPNNELRGGGHWREHNVPSLGNEIMTPIVNDRGNVISRITLGALEDIGYTVDYDQAEMLMPDSIVASIDTSIDNGVLDTDLSTDTTAGDITGFPGEADYYPGSNADETLTGTANDDLIYGGGGNDTLKGFAGNDLIGGDNDHDRLIGGNDNDTLEGGSGNDIIYGQNQHDRLLGDSGNDRLFGARGSDILFGGIGRDSLNGGIGFDRLYGQDGDDLVLGYEQNDLLYGDAGADFVKGGFGDDTLDGGSGNDILYGQTDGDLLRGGDGDDFLTGAKGNDTLNGGTGNDTFSFDMYSSFDLDVIGSDRITDFDKGNDKIRLDKTTFDAISSQSGIGISNPSDFAVVGSGALTSSEEIILYKPSTRSLYYNENSSEPGFGSGGRFAVFTGTPNVSADDFIIAN